MGRKPKSISVSEKLNSCYVAYKQFRGSRLGQGAVVRIRRAKLGDITILVWEPAPDSNSAAVEHAAATEIVVWRAGGARREAGNFGPSRADRSSANLPLRNGADFRGCKHLKNRETRKEFRPAPSPSRPPASADRSGRSRVCEFAATKRARKFSWLQALEKSRNAEGISLRAGAVASARNRAPRRADPSSANSPRRAPASADRPGGPEFVEFATTKRRGNFPGCKPLKSRETRKESRCASAHR